MGEIIGIIFHSMERFVNILNNDFQRYLCPSDTEGGHLFFDSFQKFWLPSIKSWENAKDFESIVKALDPDGTKYPHDPNVDISKIKTIDSCKIEPNKTITDKRLKELFEFTMDDTVTNFNLVRDEINTMFDYNLPSTISDLDAYLEKSIEVDIRNKDIINILIVGAGPIGLFTALYLNEYYNSGESKPNYLNTHINILLLDNRTYSESVKLPYSRMTQFGFNKSFIQPFVKRIYCWDTGHKYERHFDFINLLENLLYLTAYNKNIPMYFTKRYETFEQIKEFAVNNNFNFVFDCTGGRLGAGRYLKADIDWYMPAFKKEDVNGDMLEVRYVSDNMYRFFVNDEEYKHTTVVLSLFDNDNKQIPVGNLFGFVTDDDDQIIIDKIKRRCFSVRNIIKISRKFKSRTLRYLFYWIITVLQVDMNTVKAVKIDTFNTNSHHVNRVAQVIDDKFVYVGLGETLGASEYGIYMGMRYGMNFAMHACNLLTSVRYF